MSIQSEIKRLESAKNDIKTAIEGKGVPVPVGTRLDEYGALVGQISTGGGGEPEPPDDGKTRLYITIPANSMPDMPPPRSQVPLYFQQTVENGVTIDWGDGSATETLPGTGKVNTTHTYEKSGDYVISLSPGEECELKLGYGTGTGNGILGNNSRYNTEVYRSMLKRAVIGRNITSITSSSFYNCFALSSIAIIKGVTSIEQSAFQGCRSLSYIELPDTVNDIGNYSFYECKSIVSVKIPNSVTNIYNQAFYFCAGVKEYRILATHPPVLENSNAFMNMASDCIIYVPKGSLEEYKSATNWSTYANKMREEGT